MVQDFINKLLTLNEWKEKIVVDRNDYLISTGQIERNIYYVISGSLRVFLEDKDEEHTIRFGYAGTLFTALDSFITGAPTSYCIQALKKSELLTMLKVDYYRLLKEHGLEEAHQHLMELLVVQQMEREVDLLTSSPEERYKRVLKRSPHLFQKIPNKYIASYLRMTPETLSRLKKS